MNIRLIRIKLTLSLCIATLLLAACGGGDPKETGNTTTGPGTNAASVTWTWVSGSNGAGAAQSSVYGTKGVAAPGNVPGVRSDPATWTDAAGNLWLFGGSGLAFGRLTGLLNDLWKYSPSTGMWTWMSGSTDVRSSGVYGTQGVPDVNNVPGARSGSASWIDSAGTLWLFGGGGMNSTGGAGLLNDLWKFNPTAGVWTWVSGSNDVNGAGVYGTKGVASTSNIPSARSSPSAWMDSLGNFWVFGGDTDSSTGALRNDLWQFNPNAGTWTWVGGANVACSNVGPPAPNCSPVYGTRGTAALSNQPSARVLATFRRDASGKFWMFGGTGFGLLGSQGLLNDLWQYDPATSMWTWVSGSNTANATPAYGTRGITAASSVPGARNAGVSWTDTAGNFWIFGGIGFDSANTQKSLNDLWKYAPASGSWTWMSGSNLGNAGPVHGTRGVPASDNVPGARYLPVSWVDASANLWMFGGFGYGAATNGLANEQDDLWKFAP